MVDTNQKEKKEHHHKDDSINIPIGNLRNNPWIISTVVLAVALILVLVLKIGSNGSSGTMISEQEAGSKVIDFVNAQVKGQGTAELISTVKEGNLYKSTIKYNGQNIPLYITLDGNYLIPQLIPYSADATGSGSTDTGSTPVEVPKSDKPVVELFVMSYCPFGTQMEKGILPVLGVLKDKVNFTLRYTHFTLHGEKEDTENFRQLCIREEQGDKFLNYIQCTLNSTDVNAPANVSSCMKSLKIDESKVNSCMSTKAKDYYAVDSGLSQSYGVQGSPTLVINGVEAQTGRSPSAVLTTICNSFSDAPSECNSALSSDSPSAGFGFNTGSGADAAAANCGF